MGFCQHPKAAETVTSSRVTVASYFLPASRPCKMMELGVA
jgi:hypothetical protein